MATIGHGREHEQENAIARGVPPPKVGFFTRVLRSALVIWLTIASALAFMYVLYNNLNVSFLIAFTLSVWLIFLVFLSLPRSLITLQERE